MRILAVCGSLQENSANRELVRLAAEVAPPGVEVVVFDGIGALPHFNPDLERTATLEVVDRWRRALAESDAVLISAPEYGFSLPGALKNAIDWVIGSGELESKTVAITAAVVASERGRRGLQALADTLGAVSVTLVGGEPIARGPHFERDVTALLADLIGRTRTAARARSAES